MFSDDIHWYSIFHSAQSHPASGKLPGNLFSEPTRSLLKSSMMEIDQTKISCSWPKPPSLEDITSPNWHWGWQPKWGDTTVEYYRYIYIYISHAKPPKNNMNWADTKDRNKNTTRVGVYFSIFLEVLVLDIISYYYIMMVWPSPN